MDRSFALALKVFRNRIKGTSAKCLVIHKNSFVCFASAGDDAYLVFECELVLVISWRFVGLWSNSEVGSIPER